MEVRSEKKMPEEREETFLQQKQMAKINKKDAGLSDLNAVHRVTSCLTKLQRQ